MDGRCNGRKGELIPPEREHASPRKPKPPWIAATSVAAVLTPRTRGINQGGNLCPAGFVTTKEVASDKDLLWCADFKMACSADANQARRLLAIALVLEGSLRLEAARHTETTGLPAA
jgi:hypothetical protein